MVLPPFNALAASAQIVFPRRASAPRNDAWQSAAWNYWMDVDEFFFGVSWLSHMLSRVRLLAAEMAPGGDEPTPLETGPALDAVTRLAGGTGGQSQLVGDAAIHLIVPGEFWLVGELGGQDAGGAQTGSAEETWAVRSADDLRLSKRKGTDWEVREGDAATAWRPLAPGSLVVRNWNPDKRYAWKADSPARHALGALASLDVINKRMMATDLSRLASNGILLYDRARLSVPARTSPAEADVDPFAAMLVAIASRGFADPTSPEATIPIPIGYDIDDLTNVDPKALMQVIRMDNGVDAELLAHRDSAVKRLAVAMDLPAEILLGIGASNHWSAWALEESAIKTHVAPLAELICRCLTIGYLLPALRAERAELTGPNGGQLLVWYDPSEITARPDRSANVVQAYDRLECSGSALRRELGVDEADAPDPAELAAMALKRAALIPALAASALEALGGPSLTADLSGAGGAPTVALPGETIQPSGAAGHGPPQQGAHSITGNGAGPAR